MKRIVSATAIWLATTATALCQQPQFPQNLPQNSVVGRLGTGPGPSQAIPFATLSANLTGARITLNSGNGQTAPGAMSGGNTFSFGAITDTPRFAGIGLGGAAPATGLEVYNAAVSPTGNGQGMFGASSTNGGILTGQGSVYDAVLANKSAAVALGVMTGTQNIVLQGTLTAASLSTAGTIAGSLCMTSGGLVLYEAAINCFAVSGITVVSGKTLTVDNTLELAGTDGTKFTFPGASDTVDTLAANQTISGNKTFSGTLNITGTGQINGTAFGTFATQNFATPPAIGGTTPNTGAFSTLTATTPIGLPSGGTNASTAAGARASAGLNIDELTSHGDSNYPIASTDRTVATSTALTAPRTWTLPSASSVNPGQHLYVQDFKGFVSNTNTLTIPRNGSDTINGGTGSQVINSANGGFLFISDGVSNWSAQATSGVASVNGQTGNVSIVAGAGMSVATSGSNITVAHICGQGLVCGASLTLYGQFWLGDYGAVCNNSTDDSTALANAITAAGAIGGAVKLPLSTCKIAGAVSVSTSISILKIEGQNKLQSGLNFTGTANLTYSTNFGNIEIRDMSITCPTTVTCITIGSSTNAPTEGTVERVRFLAGGTELSLINAGAFHIQNNDFFQCTTQCVLISAPANVDGGDAWFAYNYMLNSGGLAGTGIGILQQSGGGWKITNNKINQFNVNYYFSAGLAGGVTSDFQIQDNSLEGCTTACILMQNTGTTGTLFNAIISTNEMGSAAGGYGIQIQANATPAIWITNINIVGNIIRGVNAAGGITVNGTVTLGINSNTIADAGTCTVGITTGATNSTGFISSNTITNCTTKVSAGGTAITAVNNGP